MMIKTEVSILPIFVICFHGCVSDVIVRPILSVAWYLSRESCTCFHRHCTVMIYANDWMHYDSKVIFGCWHIAPSHCHHRSDFFKGFEHILFYYYYMKCLFKMKSILTIVLFAIIGSVCYQPIHLFLKTISVRHVAIIKFEKNIH